MFLFYVSAANSPTKAEENAERVSRIIEQKIIELSEKSILLRDSTYTTLLTE